MSKTTMRIQLLIFILLTSYLTHAQHLTLPLWPEGVPGLITPLTLEEKIEMENGYFRRIRQVTDPLLQVYQPESPNPSRSAIIVCPGGGYTFLSWQFEGVRVAQWLNSLGIVAIVLKSRLPEDQLFSNSSHAPLEDVRKAITMVRDRSAEWKIDPGKIGIAGFSAGGHLAASASTQYSNDQEKPNFSILIYPVITMDESFTHMGSRMALIGPDPTPEMVRRFSNELQVSRSTPPAFMVHTTDDEAVPYANSVRYFEALTQAEIEGSELHLFPQGGHGYNLAIEEKGTISSWPSLCERWLQANGWIE